MVGHSTWSKDKRIKGPLDVKRGAAFSKLVKEFTVAARIGDGDPSGNHRLRSLVATSRGQNMPKEYIERASEKGTGQPAGGSHHETPCKGHASGGGVLVIEAATDNKNRTACKLRFILNKNHGSFAAARLSERLHAVAAAPGAGGIATDSSKSTCLPDNAVPVNDEETAAPVLELHEALEEHDGTTRLSQPRPFRGPPRPALMHVFFDGSTSPSNHHGTPRVSQAFCPAPPAPAFPVRFPTPISFCIP